MTSKRSEHEEQVALFEWAALNEGRHPDLAYLFAIPNGGHRHIAVAKRMKAEGVRSGVPDVCLPVPRGEFHGLYVEMKVKSGRVRQSQREWIAFLREQGYRVEVCYGWDEAVQVVEGYLSSDRTLRA